jgi:Beta-lactamase
MSISHSGIPFNLSCNQILHFFTPRIIHHAYIFFLMSFLLHHALTLYPPTGLVIPPPSILQSLDLSNLTKILNDISINSTTVEWNPSTTPFSIEMKSVNSTLFTYHHTAPLRNASGTQRVDGDTIFRVGSVTKVFTVLVALQERSMRLEDLITKYVKELNSSK